MRRAIVLRCPSLHLWSSTASQQAAHTRRSPKRESCSSVRCSCRGVHCWPQPQCFCDDDVLYSDVMRSCRSLACCQPAADDAGSTPSTPANPSTGAHAGAAALQNHVSLQQHLIGRISTPMGPPAAVGTGQLSLGSLLVAAQVRAMTSAISAAAQQHVCLDSVQLSRIAVLCMAQHRHGSQPCMTALIWSSLSWLHAVPCTTNIIMSDVQLSQLLFI